MKWGHLDKQTDLKTAYSNHRGMASELEAMGKIVLTKQKPSFLH